LIFLSLNSNKTVRKIRKAPIRLYDENIAAFAKNEFSVAPELIQLNIRILISSIDIAYQSIRALCEID
jgi:hypothetical protein